MEPLLDVPEGGEHHALIAAARQGRLELVRALLERGADPAKRMPDGAHALDGAAEGGHLAVVEQLLARDPELLDLPGFCERTALIAAAGEGHAQLVRALLERGADPRRRADNGARALDLAASQGQLAVVQLLLAHDPQLLDLPGGGENTALMVAAGWGHAEVVRVLLERGADARKRLADGRHALDWAAHRGHPAAVEQLLTHDPLLLRLPGYDERTALIAASMYGHAEVVRVLLARGAHPRKRLASGFRALDLAAHQGHQAVVERLLAHDPQLLDLPGAGERTALVAAAASGHAKLVRALLERGADPRKWATGGPALLWAAHGGHQATVEQLIEHDPQLLDLPGHGEWTALYMAAYFGHVELVRALLGRGADPRKRTANGSHALEGAAEAGRQAVVEQLLAHDPLLLDLPGSNECTALIRAAVQGHIELLRALLVRGADPRRRDASGAHALEGAAAKGHLAVVEQLLAHDAQLLDLSGSGERTALIAAAGHGHVEVVRALLERGADPRKRASDGARALDSAAQEGHLAVVKQLLAHDPQLLDLPGLGERTALSAARRNGHEELARVLVELGADSRTRTGWWRSRAGRDRSGEDGR